MADRDPCPHRIVGDVGGAFAFGLGGGGIWHSVKGFRNSPKGQGTQGAIKAVMVSDKKSESELACFAAVRTNLQCNYRIVCGSGFQARHTENIRCCCVSRKFDLVIISQNH